jgi:hypothetical protein
LEAVVELKIRKCHGALTWSLSLWLKHYPRQIFNLQGQVTVSLG